MKFIVFLLLLSSCSINIYIGNPIDKNMNLGTHEATSGIRYTSISIPDTSIYMFKDIDPKFYMPVETFRIDHRN